ncbi:hypothetical protein [Roseiconus lacunae]|uniref:hypothetical protein n=1 Tax=Roseiconus lacunae TaxID=2605694 RepID=UPI001E4E78A9|nr:hypothetical protein [Roseiconus lacunae]MCD0462152.1 hypothetical protein [Roseiconus lacunae]
MKASHIAVAVLAVVITSGCGRAPPPNLTAEQVDQILDTQSMLAKEQAALDRGRDALEEDRRRWADRDRREPIIAESIKGAAVLLVCSLPMVIVAHLLLGLVRSTSNELPVEMTELKRMIGSDPELLRDKRQQPRPSTSQSKSA